MSSPTQTHVDFVKEPIGQKVVTKLAGVGPVLGERLAKAGFDKARVVLGKFLILKEDEEKFKRWFKETTKANDMETTGANDKTTGANEAHAAACYNCLKEWCKAHL
jgi:hypothetical protein